MQIVGHRGAKGEAPENTLAGFTYAQQRGLRAVEFDVRLTKDNQVVVMHDATVDRTTNGSGAVQDLTLAELTALDARADFPHWPVECPVPHLSEVLDFMHDIEIIEIEFKRDAPDRIDRLAQLVVREMECRTLLGRIVFSSFDPVALEIIQHYAPDQHRAYIGTWDTPDFFDTARTLGCTQADIPFRTGTVEAVNRAHDEGLFGGGVAV